MNIVRSQLDAVNCSNIALLLLTLQASRAQQLSVDDDSDSSEGTSDFDEEEAEEDDDNAGSAVSGGAGMPAQNCSSLCEVGDSQMVQANFYQCI